MALVSSMTLSTFGPIDSQFQPRMGNRSAQKELLKQRMLQVQSRTAETLQCADKIASEQAAMCALAKGIGDDQNQLQLAVQKEESHRKKAKGKFKEIKQSHVQISMSRETMLSILQKMSSLPNILENQFVSINLTFDEIAQKQEVLSQQIFILQNHQSAISQNLLLAAEKAEQVQQQVVEIKENAEEIELQTTEIKESRDALQNCIEVLQAVNSKPVNVHDNVAAAILAEKVRENFWTALLSKIIAYASWLFSKMAELVAGYMQKSSIAAHP